MTFFFHFIFREIYSVHISDKWFSYQVATRSLCKYQLGPM